MAAFHKAVNISMYNQTGSSELWKEVVLCRNIFIISVIVYKHLLNILSSCLRYLRKKSGLPASLFHFLPERGAPEAVVSPDRARGLRVLPRSVTRRPVVAVHQVVSAHYMSLVPQAAMLRRNCYRHDGISVRHKQHTPSGMSRFLALELVIVV